MSVALVGWQAWRNADASAVVEGRLTHIEQNTKEPPKVQVNVQPTPVVVQRTTPSNELTESPCSHPISEFKQERFRPRLDDAPDLVFGIRVDVSLHSKEWQPPAHLRLWTSVPIGKQIDGGGIERRSSRYEDQFVGGNATSLREEYLSDQPIKIVCVDLVKKLTQAEYIDAISP